MNTQDTQGKVCHMMLSTGQAAETNNPDEQSVLRAAQPDFEEIVERYYRPLFQFALSLSRSEAEAFDLTQHTFYTWGQKGGQLRDSSKIRAWLFTTLHRAFLQSRRRETRFPHHELSQVDGELPEVPALVENHLDGMRALEALEEIDEMFRAPLVLFYLEDWPYKQIAEILGVPLGTVKSRIARGIAHLQKQLTPPLVRCEAA